MDDDLSKRLRLEHMNRFIDSFGDMNPRKLLERSELDPRKSVEIVESVMSLLDKLPGINGNKMVFNDGNESCVHRWEDVICECPWNSSYGLVVIVRCMDCGREELKPGGTVLMNGAEYFLEPDGSLGGCLG